MKVSTIIHYYYHHHYHLYQKLLERNSITVCIQHTYDKIITEELVAFVYKLSVVASGVLS